MTFDNWLLEILFIQSGCFGYFWVLRYVLFRTVLVNVFPILGTEPFLLKVLIRHLEAEQFSHYFVLRGGMELNWSQEERGKSWLRTETKKEETGKVAAGYSRQTLGRNSYWGFCLVVWSLYKPFPPHHHKIYTVHYYFYRVFFFWCSSEFCFEVDMGSSRGYLKNLCYNS
jgi:hypothetical protein